MSENEDDTAHTLAKRYASISLRLKGLSDSGKSLRKERKEVTPLLIDAMNQAGIERITFQGQGAITLKTRDVKEKLSPELLAESFAAFLDSKKDDIKLSKAKRAAAATAYVFKQLASDEKSSLAFRAPKKLRAPDEGGRGPRKNRKVTNDSDDVVVEATLPLHHSQHT
jgi:hypothetical protein